MPPVYSFKNPSQINHELILRFTQADGRPFRNLRRLFPPQAVRLTWKKPFQHCEVNPGVRDGSYSRLLSVQAYPFTSSSCAAYLNCKKAGISIDCEIVTVLVHELLYMTVTCRRLYAKTPNRSRR